MRRLLHCTIPEESWLCSQDFLFFPPFPSATNLKSLGWLDRSTATRLHDGVSPAGDSPIEVMPGSDRLLGTIASAWAGAQQIDNEDIRRAIDADRWLGRA